jgi:hypothetical protein
MSRRYHSCTTRIVVSEVLRSKIPDRIRIKDRLGVEFPALDLSRGGVVGITNIIGCVSSLASPWFEGEFGFVLDGSRAMPFFPWKGSLGLRDAPNNLLESIEAFV